MNDREKLLERILDCGVTAIVRVDSAQGLLPVVEALQRGGVNVVEITMTTPNALEIIRETRSRFGDQVLLGAGTVLDAETARAAILAGADFIVSPITDEATIRLVHRYSKVVMPGAFTPTEVVRAWELGADVVKIFPTSSVGPEYIRDLKGPLPHVRMIPTGGVSLETAAAFLRAGACALAVGGNLVKKQLVAEGRYDEITELAKKFVQIVREVRGR
ncbi:MAG: bifunctional 4-hydroxy-2-oxoglutarate aldolase/2-dehydro-3-deoxy-phosphogluconate aldolase [candidate division KSB1 bacterium]|nr:bifunctional 4-hydroxy-2-oxoglutarate aldolase/2-dehydro-3-deoxy-phosphogluconate aldolase [candidate division KSB1 bacterium]